MSINFPDAPTAGTVHLNYRWDGEKWVNASAGGGLNQDTADLRYVLKTGDTMTGSLAIQEGGLYLNAVNGRVEMNNTGGTNVISSSRNGMYRWVMELGNGIAEGGSNSGSNFSLIRYNDAGVIQDVPMHVNRATGTTQFTEVESLRQISSGVGGATGTYYFGNTGTKYLHYDGTIFHMQGGSLAVAGNVHSAPSGAPTTGTYYFGSSGQRYLAYDGTSYIMPNARLYTSGFQSSPPSGSFSPNSSTDGAAVVVVGDYGGGITFADGAGRASIWAESSVLVMGTGGPASSRKLQLSSSDNHTMWGHLSINGNLGSNGSIAGNSLQAYAADAINLNVPGGSYARYGTTVTGVRSYKFGAAPDGDFVLTDESAGAFRLRLSYGGTWNLNGPLQGVSNLTTGGSINCGYGYATKSGVSGGYGGNYFNFQYSGGNVSVFIDATNLGAMYIISDYRTKKDISNLSSTWDIVKQLRPIKYTQAEFQPPAQAAMVEEALAKSKEAKHVASEGGDDDSTPVVSDKPLFEADDIERWGFLAHELQDTLVPSAASGVKDSPDTIQSPNPWTVIAALTRALQEAMTRIEALENA